MIKTLSKLLNNRLLIHKSIYRFTAPKNTQQSPQQPIQPSPQQLQQIKQQTNVQQTGQNLYAQSQQVVSTQQIQQDPYQGITFQQSNWKDMAHIINTSYHHQAANNFLLQREVHQKLNKIQQLYNLDIQNLDKIKIYQSRQFQIRSSINALSNQSNRYLQTSINQNTKIGFNMMTGKKFKQFLQTNNLQAIKQLYRNNQFNTFVIQADVALKIIDQVVNDNFNNHFLLNLLQCLRNVDQSNLLKPNKNFEKILLNIHDLHQLNKLKFFWRIYSTVQHSNQYINLNVINHQLTKISLDQIDQAQSQKTLRNIYSAVLGKEAMKKFIYFSLQKFSASFNNFVQFWALFNMLITRLVGLNQSSLQNPHSLNAIFNLFELNLQEPKQILTQIIPQALFQTKNKMLFEIYRVHAKFWAERKTDPKLTVQAGVFDQFINKKIDLQDQIKVSYNPWPKQDYFPTRTSIRTSKNNSKNIQRLDQLLSQTKMIQHLIRGDYSFVLNHFLLVFNPGLQKQSYNDLRKILQQAKQRQFTDQNAKALYILKQINQRFFYSSQPTAFRQQFLLPDYKKIKWLQKKQAQPIRPRKSVFQKMMQEDEGKYSRKRAQKLDPQQTSAIDNKQRIYSKGKKPKQGALFSKKNKNLFSTQKDAYTQYRQVVKELTKQTTGQFGFSIQMDRSTDLNTFKQQVQRRSRQMNENNHKTLFSMNHLPIVGSGANLMKYLFLKKPEGQVSKVNQDLKKRLKVSFVSQIGALQKDFSQYLQGNRFTFALDKDVYIAMLQDQKANYVRKSFKTILTHMIAYRRSISDQQVKLICQICKKNRIGITLIEIYNLMIQNKTLVSKQALYIFCDSLQKFKKINGDIFMMTKKYCDNIGIQFQTNMMSSYVKSLLIQQQDQKLSQLCQTLKTQLRPKPYKVKPNLSADQNLKLQKQYKQFQKNQYNRILNQVINMVVINVNNKLPTFVSQLFDQFQKSQPKLEAKDIAISLIVYCNDVDKFLQIIRTLKAEPQKIILTTFQCAIKALRLNMRGLESHSQQIFNVTLFTHNFILNEDLITKSVQIFKFLSSPTVFIKFLEYLLRYNPALNYEVKNGMYFVMNNINDDFAKNTISGLLDFIFNSNRQKERQQYRKAQIVQEQKAKLLQDLQKKDFFFDKTEKQKQQIVNDIEAGNLQDAKKPKKNVAPQKQKAAKQAAKAKTDKPGSQKQQKRKVNLKGSDAAIFQQSDGILKKSNLKRKLRSKSLNNFEEMFTQRQQTTQQIDPKAAKAGAKGKQPAPKDDKNNKKKGK